MMRSCPAVVAIALLSLRVASVLIVRTWFVPDELFQSLEPAHSAIFGTGHLSWEWRNALRSVLHPSIVALAYCILDSLGIDSNFAVIFVPRLVHALLFAVSDVCFLRLARRLLAPVEARFALFSYVTCWFVWYCAPRTLSNSLETALTLIALNWYPFKRAEIGGSLNCWPYMAIGALTIVIRPTAVLLWAPFGLWHFMRSQSRCRLILYTCIPAMLPVVALAFVMDSLAYGEWTLSTWNFAKFNVFDGGSAHFGVHPWHWYVTQGLPAVLTVQMVPVIGGVIGALRYRRVTLSLLCVSAFYVLFHSCLPHKEHRFLLPIIPMLSIYAGHFFGMAGRRAEKKRKGEEKGTGRMVVIVMVALVVVNVPLAIYTSMWHQAGPISAARFIYEDARERFGERKKFEVLQLMPCYSMPQYTHMHGLNCSVRALDCSPNLERVKDFVDEADRFHEDPMGFVEDQEEKGLMKTTDYVVIYERMWKRLGKRLKKSGFRQCARLFHAHFLTSARQDNYMVVLCRH